MIATHLLAAPTHAMAIEWIRVNFGIWISIAPDHYDSWGYEISAYETEPYDGWFSVHKNYEFKNNKEASEQAIIYFLKNLINHE